MTFLKKNLSLRHYQLMMIYFTIISVGLFPIDTVAQIRFGAEFTLTSRKMAQMSLDGEDSVSESYKQLDLQLRKVRALHEEFCKSAGCTLKDSSHFPDLISKNGYRIYFSDSSWVEFDFDVKVIEIRTKPMTRDEIMKNKDIMQKLIFDLPAQAQLFPNSGLGMGHIHFSAADAFNYGQGASEKILLFRNYLVDFFNQPVLTRIFGKDVYNAPSLSDHPKEIYQAVRQLIAEVDAGKFSSIKSIAAELESRVYEMTKHKLGWNDEAKFQALNVVRTANRLGVFQIDQITVEARAYSAQTSMDEYLFQTGLIELQLAQLDAKDHRLQLENAKQVGLLDFFHITIEQFKRYLFKLGFSEEIIKLFVKTKYLQNQIQFGDLDSRAKFYQRVQRGYSELNIKINQLIQEVKSGANFSCKKLF